MKTVGKKTAPARWSPALKKLKAISLRQPWAWLVVNGYKDIENRKWATKVRGPVLIHAGQSMSDFSERCLYYVEQEYGVRVPNELELGGIVGVAEIVDCTKKHRSKWFRGPFGWVVTKARSLPFKPCAGKLKFFAPDIQP